MILRQFVQHMPAFAQIMLFDAPLSAIMITASGTLLAPSVTVAEYIIKEFMPHDRMSQKKLPWITRSVVVALTLRVAINSLWSLESETSIHQMVGNACKATPACAFCR